jgi:galacturan 1,4-alpha-galacturonidase
MRSPVASAALLVTSALLCLLASPALVAAARSTGRTTLSVLSFGAAADGVTDDAEVLARIIFR